jgi:hypothetical protein
MLGTASIVLAQDEQMVAERPGTTASGVVVQLGRAQFEGGMRVVIDRDSKTVSGPEFLVRLGVLPRVEFRLKIPDYQRTSSSRGTHGRLDNTYVGLKLQLLPADSRFAFAFIPGFTAPADENERGDAAPAVLAATSLQSVPKFIFAANLGREWRQRARRGEDVVTAVLSVTRDLGGRFSTFAEWSAEIPDRGESAQALHHGYMFAVSPDGQIDIHIGVGLTEAAPDVFVGAGFVVRH